MSGILGILHFDGKPVEIRSLESMLHVMAHRGPDGGNLWRDRSLGLGHLMLRSTPESLCEVLPYEDSPSGLSITADARLDGRQELLQKLGVTESSIPDSRLILAAYQKWGESCVDHLLGDFAFVIADSERNRMFCARDHLGFKPFYYFNSGDLFVFASSALAVFEMPETSSSINEGRIADYLLQDLEGIDQESTFFADICRLPPAHIAVVERAGLRLHRYWSPDLDRDLRLPSDEEYVDALEEVLSVAVADRLRSNTCAASMLSGGVDSSTIVALAREQRKSFGEPKLMTVSAVSHSPGSLEAGFIRKVVEQGGVHSFQVCAEQVTDHEAALRRIFNVLEDPFDGFMLMQMILYLTAGSNGATALLDGVDGDMTASLSPYYPAWLLRDGHWKEFVTETRGTWENYHLKERPVWKVYSDMLRYFVSSGVQHSRYYHPYATFRMRQRLKRTLVSESLIERVDVLNRYQMYFSSFRSKLDEGLKVSHQKRVLVPYLTAGIERYGRVAAYCGIENRSPLMDKRVVEFFLSLPWRQKVRQGRSKYLLRCLAERRLPHDVAWRADYDHPGWGFTREWIRLNERQLERDAKQARQTGASILNPLKFESFHTGEVAANEDNHASATWRVVNLFRWLDQHSGNP